MKRCFPFFFILAVLAFYGCSQQTGPAGPQGSAGPSGPSDFETAFQDGVFPTASYSGTTNTWLDAANPTTSHSGAASLRVAMGAASSNYGRVLIKFDISSLPQNVVILKAALLLKTQTTSNLSSGITYSIGVNDMNVPAMVSGGCTWNLGANWNSYNASGGWSTCNGSSAGFIRGTHYVSPPMYTVSFTSAVNGTAKIYAWNLTPSVVQAWITGVNDGLTLGSNSDSGESTGNIDFYPNTDATALNHPELIVSYNIP